MKKDKIQEAYEEMLNELYGISGRAIGVSQSGSKGQRAMGVAPVCPTCGDLDDHDHKNLKSGDKCPKCGQIVESKLDESPEGDKLADKLMKQFNKIIATEVKKAKAEGIEKDRLTQWVQWKISRAWGR